MLTGDAAFAAGALWGANQFYAGSPASAAIASNAAGNVAITAPVAGTTIQTADGAIALTGVNVSLAGGAAAGRNALVNAQGAGGTLDVTARTNVTITGGSAAGVTAAMQSAASQNVAAGGALSVTGGSANNATATLAVTADAAQTIDVGGTLTVQGGAGAAVTGSVASIVGRGTQSIDANAIAITSAATGTGNNALINNTPGAGAGTTTLRANTTITETNNAGGRAFIGDATGTLGNVSVDLQAGGNIAITSGLAVGGTATISMAADAAFAAGQLWAANRFFTGSAASAAVASNNAGNVAFTAPVAGTTVQTANGGITLSGVNVTLAGGAAAGRDVIVNAQGANGTLDVTARNTTAAAGDVIVTGGTAAGVTAALQSAGAQSIGATRNVTVTGGNFNGATATIAVTGTGTQTIDAAGTVTVQAGTGAAVTGSVASIVGRGTQSIDANAITLASGAAGTGNNALINNVPGAGAGSTTLRAIGNITETNNAGGRAFIGDATGTLGDVSVNLQAGGAIGITSSLAVGGTAGIAMTADAAYAAGDLWAANRFYPGSAASAAVAANGVGNLAFTAPVAATTVQTANGAIALAGANVTATGGAAAGRSVLINAQGAGGTLDVTARTNLSITGGSVAGVTAAMQSTAAQNVAAGGNLTITGGNANNAAATLAVTADAAQTLDVGGTLTVQAGTGAAVTGAVASIRGRGAQSIDVGGNVLVASGAAGTGNNAVIDNTPTTTGSTTLRALGNITETNAAGGRAWLGAAGSGAFTNVAVDVQAAGDITLASGMSTNASNALSIQSDQAFAAGALWGANRFFTGSAASAATASNGFGGVILNSGAAASTLALTTAAGNLTVVSAARNASNTLDMDVTLGTGVNQLSLASTAGNIAVGDTAVSGVGNRSFRNVVIANPIATSGSVTVEANNTLTANAFVLGNAGVTLAADADNSGAGALALNSNVTSVSGPMLLAGAGVTQAAITTANAGTGTLTVDGNDGAITLSGSLTTTNATAGAVVIRDAASASLSNVSAVNGTVVLGQAGVDNISGGVTQAVGTAITAAGLAGNVGGNVTLANANDFTGAAGVQAGGNVRLNDVNALSVGPITAGGTVLATAGGNLTLGGNITASGAGDAVVLVAGTGAAFLNSGANGISTPSGRWLVYSNDPAADSFGGLASGQQALWNRSYPTAVPEAGNRYVFAIQPTVTVTSTDVTKTYGTNATATVAAAFTTSGFVDASLYGNVFTQDTAANALTGSVTSAGSAAIASVAGSPYATVVAFTNATGYAVINNAAGRVFVNPAALTVTADNATKTYGQTTTFTGTEFTPTGLQNGETIGSVTLASAGAAPTAGVLGSPYAITASNAAGGSFDANNYSITYVNGQLTVTPAALTVTANNAAKTYGQTVTFNGTEFTTSALQNGESVNSVTLASAGAAATAGVVGSPYAIVASNATGGGTFNAANYNILYTNGQLTVNPAALTVTANNATKTYGQTTTFAGTEFTPAGLQNGETIGSVTLASAGVAPAAGVAGSPYAINASAATGGTFNAANYNVSYVDGQLTVNPATLNVTANSQSKVYGNTFTFTGGEFTPTGLQNGETIGSVTLASAGAAATATVPGGPYAINASNATGGTFNAANYNIGYTSGTMTVTPRPLAVAGDNQTKVYGTPDPALTYTAPGLVNGDTLSGALTRVAGETVTGGPYAITQGTLANANYAITYTNGALTITPAALLIAANNASRLYGEANPAFNATFTGLANGDTAAAITGLAFNTPATIASNVGTYAITPLGAANPNYSITYANGALAVTPAPLVITAADAARLFGQPNPPFTASFTGFRLGQTLADLSGTLDLSSPALATSLPGIYPIVPSGVSSLNYAVTFVNGELLVSQTAPPVANARDAAVMRSETVMTLQSAAGGCAAPLSPGLINIAMAPGLCIERPGAR